MEEDGVKFSQMPKITSLSDSTTIAGLNNGQNVQVPANLLKGQKGDTGPAGADGAPGAQGERGPQGVQGEQGIQGEQGEPGAQGPQGIPGEKGEKGDPGTGIAISGEVATYADLPTNLTEADAGNAYIVKADGLLYIWSGTSFPADGTGTQFVGPKGDKGDKGDQGEKGETGEQGPEGPQGEQGEKGEKGDPGEKGEKGDPGERGEAGAGLTIGGEVDTYADLPSDLTEADAGKAYINKADSKLYVWTGTAFPAEGEGSAFVGPKGPKGDTGEQGQQGEKGDQGTVGPQGPQGVQGETGVGISAVALTETNGLDFTMTDGSHLTITDSIRGPQGIQGPKGEQGETGPQGEQGIQGERGEQGIQGIQGEQGPQGIQGEPGSDASVDIQQDTGTSTTSVMSQKAISDAITTLQNQVQTDLESYYTKTETDQMVSAIPKFAIEVVETLPVENISATTVYLVPANTEGPDVYTEYIYVDSKWERLGVQTVDLTNYSTKDEINALLADYYTKTEADNTFVKQSAIVQELGTSETAVMSQAAINATIGDINTILESI